MKVNEIMTQPVITIGEDTPLQEAARIMLQDRIGGIPVVDKNGNLVGIVTETDFTAKGKMCPVLALSCASTFRHMAGQRCRKPLQQGQQYLSPRGDEQERNYCSGERFN